MTESVKWSVALVSGGMAGTAVDVSLFPLDTIKTRLQSSQGFWKAGGLKNIYSGIGPAAAGSAPTAAVFFLTYEASKELLGKFEAVPVSVTHMAAASISEVTACLVRVPVEVIKQRRQAYSKGPTSGKLILDILKREGYSGLYRGYWTTVFRDIPFSLVQFPIWEYFKIIWSRYQNKQVDPWQSAICGAFAGGISGAVTTPFDVAKTRIILASSDSKIAQKDNLGYALKMIWKDNGLKGLFSGALPRTMWISIGGAVFFGVYEKTKSLLLG